MWEKTILRLDCTLSKKPRGESTSGKKLQSRDSNAADRSTELIIERRIRDITLSSL